MPEEEIPIEPEQPSVEANVLLGGRSIEAVASPATLTPLVGAAAEADPERQFLRSAREAQLRGNNALALQEVCVCLCVCVYSFRLLISTHACAVKRNSSRKACVWRRARPNCSLVAPCVCTGKRPALLFSEGLVDSCALSSLRRHGPAASGFEEVLAHVDRNALARAEAVVYLASSCQCERQHAVRLRRQRSHRRQRLTRCTRQAAVSWATQAINELRPPRRLLAFATRVRGMSHLALASLDLAVFDLTSALAIDPLDCTSLTMRAGSSRSRSRCRRLTSRNLVAVAVCYHMLGEQAPATNDIDAAVAGLFRLCVFVCLC